MTASAIIFYLIAAFILAAGLLAMTTRKIFRSAIWLLFSLIGVAALYFWLQVEFIAAVQIIVYVGGIVVLIIFSIFLTQQSGKEMPRQPLKRIIASTLAVVMGFGLVGLQLLKYHFLPSGKNFDWTVAQIGSQMLSTSAPGYALPFEVVTVLLLAAMIGCIVIAMKTPHNVPVSTSEDQIQPRLRNNGVETTEQPNKEVLPIGEDHGDATYE